MNSVLYYGGFGLAIALFLAAAAFFFIFRIPEVIKYLQKTNRKGLVEAANVDIKNTQPPQSRKSQAFADKDDRTELLEYVQATAILNSDQTAVLDETATIEREKKDATEILS